MQLTLLVNGKLENKLLVELVDEYKQRIEHYLPFQIEVIAPPTSSAIRKDAEKLKLYEAEQILKRIKPGDSALLLDEKGTEYTSRQLATQLQKVQLSGIKKWIWVIGGPYGFHTSVYKAVPRCISLSKLTFTHDMVRLIAVEQLYRAISILNNLPYHHD